MRALQKLRHFVLMPDTAGSLLSVCRFTVGPAPGDPWAGEGAQEEGETMVPSRSHRPLWALLCRPRLRGPHLVSLLCALSHPGLRLAGRSLLSGPWEPTARRMWLLLCPVAVLS